MEKAARAIAETAGRIAERFEARFAQAVSLARDRDLSAALALEARPVAEMLLYGLAGGASGRGEELREATALASLLGRRAAALGATPSAALAIVPCLLEAAETDVACAHLAPSLCAVCLEGYVAAREEALAAAAARRAADAIPIVELAPGCIGVFAAGDQDAAEIERVADELGRLLLDREARACLMHVAGLRAPDRERALRLFAAQATCRMLGVRCYWSGVTEGWRRAADEAGVDLSEICVEPDLGSGLAAVLRAAGLELRAVRPPFADRLRRIVRRDRP